MIFRHAQKTLKRAHNWDSDNNGSWMVSGNKFHKVEPESAKLCCPYLVILEWVQKGCHELQIGGDFDLPGRTIWCMSILHELVVTVVYLSILAVNSHGITTARETFTIEYSWQLKCILLNCSDEIRVKTQ